MWLWLRHLTRSSLQVRCELVRLVSDVKDEPKPTGLACMLRLPSPMLSGQHPRQRAAGAACMLELPCALLQS